MKLQKHIRKILKEETRLPYKILRRIDQVDMWTEEVIEWMEHNPHNRICSHRNHHLFIETVFDIIVTNLYHTLLDEIGMTTSSNEWPTYYDSIIKYLTQTYKDRLIQIYNNKCG